MTIDCVSKDNAARHHVEGGGEDAHAAAVKELAMTSFGPQVWPERYEEAADDTIRRFPLTMAALREQELGEPRPMTGFFGTLSNEQKAAALAYRGPESHGDPAFANDNRGPYISTFTGRFYMFDPRPDEVRIKDIAHGLSRICRYTGAVKEFYSVAEHSVHIARWLLKHYGPVIALQGLLHDSPEALSGFGDVARPAKQRALVIKETEERIYTLAIAPAFGMLPALAPEVHEADNRIIADEMAQSMHEVDPGYRDPLGITLEFWSPERAEIYFLDMFRRLTSAKTGVVA